MKPKYFNSIGALNNYADSFPTSSFTFEPNPRKCGCNSVRVSYEVTDKQDNDILAILILCPACANNPKNCQ